MDFYKGNANDILHGGGKHVENEGWGGEMYNFKAFNDKVYGYVQPKIDKKYGSLSTIRLEKIEAGCNEDILENVTIVWTATDPINRGTYIVGWYLNATILRYAKQSPLKHNRKYKGINLDYFCFAKAKDAHLLLNDSRQVPVKRQAKNWMGQSNVWYADKNPKFVEQVKNYIFNGIIPKQPAPKQRPTGRARQMDVLKRMKVETNAINEITKHYTKLGYKVQSVEKDNVGWDLNATNNRQLLRLEVKGLSGSQYIAELTPNEFKKMHQYKSTYRICIVIEALEKMPKYKIFAYSTDIGAWVSEDNKILNIVIIESARVSI
jgi:Domain of unknown function (DUF3883)